LTDPVGRGLVVSLARPQGKLTGFSRAIEKLTVKRLELLHEMLPRARRVGFVFVSDNRGHLQQAADVKAAGQSMGLQVIEYTLPVRRWSEEPLDAMFSRIRQENIDAILLPDINALPSTLVALVAKYRLPTIHSLTHVVTDWGGLAAYSTAPSGMDSVAGYADRILRGTAPADLPVQESERYELVLNQRAARDIGISFPPTLLMRATQVLSK
jgi:putative ABC transport system substrate-binding protein